MCLSGHVRLAGGNRGDDAVDEESRKQRTSAATEHTEEDYKKDQEAKNERGGQADQPTKSAKRCNDRPKQKESTDIGEREADESNENGEHEREEKDVDVIHTREIPSKE